MNSLDVKPAVGVSTLKEMLHDVLGDAPQQVERFASLYVRHQDDMPTFWSNLEAELGEAKTKRLRLDGQLGYLTMNHAPLIRNLHETERENPLTSTLDLAKRGYYEADKWLSLLDGAIPPNIPGETDAEKRKQYAELLAAQVRLAFPTAVIADRVQRGHTDPDGGRRGQGRLRLPDLAPGQVRDRRRAGRAVPRPQRFAGKSAGGGTDQASAARLSDHSERQGTLGTP